MSKQELGKIRNALLKAFERERAARSKLSEIDKAEKKRGFVESTQKTLYIFTDDFLKDAGINPKDFDIVRKAVGRWTRNARAVLAYAPDFTWVLVNTFATGSKLYSSLITLFPEFKTIQQGHVQGATAIGTVSRIAEPLGLTFSDAGTLLETGSEFARNEENIFSASIEGRALAQLAKKELDRLQFEILNSSRIKEIGTLSVELVRNAIISTNLKDLGRLEVAVIVPQVAQDNLAQASAESEAQKDLEAAVDILREKLLDSLIDLKGSPSISDKVFNRIQRSAGLNVPDLNTRKHTTVSKSKKPRISVLKKQRVVIAPIQRKFQSKPGVLNVAAILSVINRKLHDAIQSNMGVSTDPPIKLRYQTGDFAKSAKAVGAIQRGQAIQIFYTYERNPYSVFEPGRLLHKPGRNPKYIIGKSIREIGIEIFLNRVRVIASEAK